MLCFVGSSVMASSSSKLIQITARDHKVLRLLCIDHWACGAVQEAEEEWQGHFSMCRWVWNRDTARTGWSHCRAEPERVSHEQGRPKSAWKLGKNTADPARWVRWNMVQEIKDKLNVTSRTEAVSRTSTHKEVKASLENCCIWESPSRPQANQGSVNAFLYHSKPK